VVASVPIKARVLIGPLSLAAVGVEVAAVGVLSLPGADMMTVRVLVLVRPQ
jgi:hypothetical protein